MGLDRESRNTPIEPDDARSSTLITDFLGMIRRFSPRVVERTATEEELRIVEPSVETPSLPTNADLQDEDDTGNVASKRVALLARAYVRGKSSEDEARLAILTERLRELLPPVSETQWAALDEVASRLDETATRHQKIRECLGLK